jgi:hypothetical protein
MPFRHVVLLTFADGTDVDAIVAALRGLADEIPELRSYVVGRDAGLSAGNASVAVVADFDDVAGFEAYRDDPRHQAVIQEFIRPALVGRAAVQHET